jgi:hypothetical protein
MRQKSLFSSDFRSSDLSGADSRSLVANRTLLCGDVKRIAMHKVMF